MRRGVIPVGLPAWALHLSLHLSIRINRSERTVDLSPAGNRAFLPSPGPPPVRFCHGGRALGGYFASGAGGVAAGSGAFGSRSTHFSSFSSAEKTIRSWSTWPDASSHG